ncbi:3-hydroxyacyl-CoA dehydrogenase family protein [Salinithrix halophila]
MTDKVLLVGRGPLMVEAVRFFEGKGVHVLPLETATYRESAEVTAVVDVMSGPLEEKMKDLREAEALVAKNVPIFSSVLRYMATRIAAGLKGPERLVGFSPLLLEEGEVLEASRPLQAEEDASWDRHLRLWERWGKRVEILGDEPGLVFPRTLALMVNEAAWILTEGGADRRDIDTAMKKGTNHPFGPLEWADQIGVDQVLAILEGLQEELGDDRYRPAPFLRRMVYAGRLGESTGQGFHRYETVKAGDGHA